MEKRAGHGRAALAMAACIDLNPVRAGMVADPAAYRWSSYGEAAGGGSETFVNEAFQAARELFSPEHKDGTRAMKGKGNGAKGLLWSLRDLHVGI